MWLIILIMSSYANAACELVQYEEGKDIFYLEHPVEAGLTVSNMFWLPKVIDEKEIIVDKGPVVIMVSDESYVSYRVIDKNEVEFIGSKKSPYDFFKSAFTNPKGIAECSFLDGVRGIKNRSYYAVNEIEYFVHEMGEYTTLYLLSKGIGVVVEITIKGLPNEVVNNIIFNAHLK